VCGWLVETRLPNGPPTGPISRRGRASGRSTTAVAQTRGRRAAILGSCQERTRGRSAPCPTRRLVAFTHPDDRTDRKIDREPGGKPNDRADDAVADPECECEKQREYQRRSHIATISYLRRVAPNSHYVTGNARLAMERPVPGPRCGSEVVGPVGRTGRRGRDERRPAPSEGWEPIGSPGAGDGAQVSRRQRLKAPLCRQRSQRRRPESNRCKRLCRPLRSHSATSPSSTASVSGDTS
jgi:hypothetical protein